MPVTVYPDHLSHLTAEVLAHPREETGGSLFGAWSSSGLPLVYLLTGPGPDARHGLTSFYPNAERLAATGAELWDHWGLQHVGEWHSHHTLALAEPSSGDIRTVLAGMDQHGLPRFLLGIACIQRHGVVTRFYLFENGSPDYRELPVRLLSGPSPFATERTWESWQHGTSDAWHVERWEATVPRRVRGWFTAPSIKTRLAWELGNLADQFGRRPTMQLRDDAVRVSLDLADRSLAWLIRDGFPETGPLFEVDGLPAESAWNANWSLHAQALDALTPVEDAPANVDETPVPPDDEFIPLDALLQGQEE